MDSIKRVPYKVIDKEGSPAVQVNINGKEQAFTLEEIVSKLFTKAKELAEGHIDQKY